MIKSTKYLKRTNKDDRTRLDIRECLGGKNLTSKSISFVGMSPKKIKEEIVKKYK